MGSKKQSKNHSLNKAKVFFNMSFTCVIIMNFVSGFPQAALGFAAWMTFLSATNNVYEALKDQN